MINSEPSCVVFLPWPMTRGQHQTWGRFFLENGLWLGHSRLPDDRPHRDCNRHDDCIAADARARTQGPKDYYGRPVYDRADHCHDDCCEDCFGS